MEIVYSYQAQLDILHFKQSGQIKVQEKITKLLDDIVLHPKTGLGKPEALKGNLSGCWSRKITHKHRLVYEFDDDRIYVHSLNGHY